jgi:hypothetical protein
VNCSCIGCKNGRVDGDEGGTTTPPSSSESSCETHVDMALDVKDAGVLGAAEDLAWMKTGSPRKSLEPSPLGVAPNPLGLALSLSTNGLGARSASSAFASAFPSAFLELLPSGLSPPLPPSAQPTGCNVPELVDNFLNFASAESVPNSAPVQPLGQRSHRKRSMGSTSSEEEGSEMTPSSATASAPNSPHHSPSPSDSPRSTASAHLSGFADSFADGFSEGDMEWGGVRRGKSELEAALALLEYSPRKAARPEASDMPAWHDRSLFSLSAP